MVHRCCIPKCGMSVRVSEAKGLSYHKFPNKETIRDQWVQAIIPHLEKPESLKVVSRYTRVCSRHFRKKDYCIDSKKRARLISNAVPSRFPRKSSPLVIPTVLPVSPKLTTSKSQISNDIVPGTSMNHKTVSSTTVGASSSATSIQTDKIAMQPKEIDGEQLVDVLGSRELIIESASIHDDLVVLTLADPVSHVEIEGVSVVNSDDQSKGVSAVKMEESGGGTKTRKRRKWNRTAFSRPAKGKRKSLSAKHETTSEQDIVENFADLHPLNDEVDSLIEIKHETLHASSSVEELQNSSNENDALSNVTLLLSDHTNQPYHIASVEQELLQSIQAVSLRCVGDHEDVEKIHEIHNPSADYVFSYNNLVPAFLHHHSSEESLFSNESQNNGGGLGDNPLSTVSQSDIATEDDSLRYNLVDLRIDPDMPSSQHPSYSDIDELAHQLNSSLFTDGKIPLFSTDNLSLNNDNSSDLNLADPLLVTPDTRTKEEPVAKSSASSTSEKLPKQSIKKSTSLKVKGTSSKEITPPKESEKASKSPKKDKVTGKFSVERFKGSDKDIEYYTGFNSYRKFEAFFRSMEAYIEKICITDVTYGVKNLPTPTPSDTCPASSAEGTLPKAVEPQNQHQPKKRPCQGRSMSRIDELFMTIIRLRRKLPEKVLGHMFFISQPTVSRVVRAWTVILSKIIDSYPTESSLSSSSPCKEHSYTCKGLGIPDSFKELFHSELANSIVITSLNPKKSKVKASTVECTRKKKSKRNSETTTKEDCKKLDLSTSDEKLLNVVDSDFLANVENPVPIEQLRLFDYI